MYSIGLTLSYNFLIIFCSFTAFSKYFFITSAMIERERYNLLYSNKIARSYQFKSKIIQWENKESLIQSIIFFIGSKIKMDGQSTKFSKLCTFWASVEKRNAGQKSLCLCKNNKKTMKESHSLKKYFKGFRKFKTFSQLL